MKLFRFIIFAALYIINTPLHAQYPEFNIGEGIDTCILSPDKKFLLTTYYNSKKAKLWNIQTGQLHDQLEECCARPFFSEDSTTIFGAADKGIQVYQITDNAVVRVASINLWNRSFDPNFETSYIHINNIFIKLGTKKNNRDGVFISKVLEANVVNTQELTPQEIQFLIHTTKACSISHDAHLAAIVCDKTTRGHFYVHVIDIENRETTHTYQIKRKSVSHYINSINFSVDNHKLVITAQHVIEAATA